MATLLAPAPLGILHVQAKGGRRRARSTENFPAASCEPSRFVGEEADADVNPFAKATGPFAKSSAWSQERLSADGDSVGTASTSGLSSPQSSPRHWEPREASPAPVHGAPGAAADGGLAAVNARHSAAAARLPQTPGDRPYLEHTVQPQDTLAGICLRYKATARELAKLNNFSGEHFRLCEVLVVPNRACRPRAAAASRGDGGPSVAALRGAILLREDPQGWLALAKLRLFVRETGVSEPRARHVLEHCSWDYELARAEWEACFGCPAATAAAAGREGAGSSSSGLYLAPQPQRLRHTRSWGDAPGARDRGWEGPKRRGSFMWEGGVEMVEMDSDEEAEEQQPLISIW